MRYPKFIDLDSTIGVCAPSCGVGRKIPDFEKSIQTLKSFGFRVKETASVRNDGMVSNDVVTRSNEFNDLIKDPNINMIMTATGGDFCMETLPYLDYDAMNKNPKWIMGASDPTSILFVTTTALDLATIYGMNAGSFDDDPLHDCQFNCVEILKGNMIEQNSFPFYEKDKNFSAKRRKLTEPVEWKTINGDFHVNGRIIGGCIDVLRNMVGTPYDFTKRFIDKYGQEGIIWYFDVFSMSSEDLYLSLFQMKLGGWFNNAKAIILGRVMYPQQFNDDFDYSDALKKIFGNLPMVYDADIGHVFPKMTIINGSVADVECVGSKGKIKFELK